ncbi:hypothetical protein T265_15717, partial [Opisthorchis viverrini]
MEACGDDPQEDDDAAVEKVDSCYDLCNYEEKNRCLVEGVQAALGAQLRLAGATGQSSVEELVRLARELTGEPLTRLQSQEKRNGSSVEELQTKVGQLAQQLAAMKTEVRWHARTSRCYKCGKPVPVPDHLYEIKL